MASASITRYPPVSVEGSRPTPGTQLAWAPGSGSAPDVGVGVGLGLAAAATVEGRGSRGGSRRAAGRTRRRQPVGAGDPLMRELVDSHGGGGTHGTGHRDRIHDSAGRRRRAARRVVGREQPSIDRALPLESRRRPWCTARWASLPAVMVTSRSCDVEHGGRRGSGDLAAVGFGPRHAGHRNGGADRRAQRALRHRDVRVRASTAKQRIEPPEGPASPPVRSTRKATGTNSNTSPRTEPAWGSDRGRRRRCRDRSEGRQGLRGGVGPGRRYVRVGQAVLEDRELDPGGSRHRWLSASGPLSGSAREGRARARCAASERGRTRHVVCAACARSSLRAW